LQKKSNKKKKMVLMEEEQVAQNSEIGIVEGDI
jgi:hypothetical protein